MSDLISRAAVIEAVHDEFDGCLVWDESGKATANEVERIIASLPSAQPKSYREGYQAGFRDAQPEPCKDAVSRADVVDMLEMFPFTEYSEYETAREVVKRLPPAQPERKKGKWTKISPASIYECSVCGQTVMTDDIEAYSYCHGCGVKMEVSE